MKYALMCYSDNTFQIVRFKQSKERTRFIAILSNMIGHKTKDGQILQEINPVKDASLLITGYRRSKSYQPLPNFDGEIYTGHSLS